MKELKEYRWLCKIFLDWEPHQVLQINPCFSNQLCHCSQLILLNSVPVTAPRQIQIVYSMLYFFLLHCSYWRVEWHYILRPFIWSPILLHKNHNIPGMTSSTSSGIKLSSYPLHMKREKRIYFWNTAFFMLKNQKDGPSANEKP